MTMSVTGRTSSAIALVGAICAAGAAEPASGQAVCSAPHSSPILLESATHRTLAAGSGWIQLSTAVNRATESFNPLGNRQDFIGGSTFRTRSAYLTAAYGITEGLEVWGQVPVHHLRAETASAESSSTGLGDLRAALRLSPALVGLDAPIALRVGAKLPGSDFPVDATQLPLTEGQEDFELSVESGWAPAFAPLYLAGWSGYRWRSENEGSRHRPGDEWFAHVAVGGSLGTIGWAVGVDALWGKAPVDQGILLTSQRRRLIQVVPTLAAPVGPGLLEASVPVPLSGRNLPAGYGASVGYRWAWGR